MAVRRWRSSAYHWLPLADKERVVLANRRRLFPPLPTMSCPVCGIQLEQRSLAAHASCRCPQAPVVGQRKL